MSVSSALANRLYLAGAMPARARFERAMRDPGAAQAAILDRIVRANADSAFGREHGFGKIRGTADFRERVPIRDAAAFDQYLQRVAEGEPGVLTSAEVRFVEPTSGSSGSTKFVPYTTALLGEFAAATLPWIYDLLRHHPSLRNGGAYWAVTPPARHPAHTAGGVAVGLAHDTDYFPAFARVMLDRALGTPRALALAPDIGTCRYLTLRALLALPDLAFISVWSPTFLTLMAGALDAEFARLVHDLDHGNLSVDLEPATRRELERALPPRPRLATELRRRFGRRAPEDLGQVWPRLTLISCWADGHAARSLAALRQRFPLVAIQPKGLLATEGVVSIPLSAARGSVPAVASHFLEFLPVDSPGGAVTVEGLDEGATYEVVLTTGGGLYRYRLRDVVRVEGRHLAVPVLSFRGRSDRTCDLAGEKLTPAFVEAELAASLRDCAIETRFAMLAPTRGERAGYTLYIETHSPHAQLVAAALERRLRATHHYALCRGLGQLAPVRAVTVHNGERTYERACIARGQRAGTIKPVALDDRLDWEREFSDRAAQFA